jgi:hypothetical protein
MSLPTKPTCQMKPPSRSTTVAHRNESTYERNRISTTISVSVVFWLLPLGPRRRLRHHRRGIKMKIEAAKKVTVDGRRGGTKTNTDAVNSEIWRWCFSYAADLDGERDATKRDDRVGRRSTTH